MRLAARAIAVAGALVGLASGPIVAAEVRVTAAAAHIGVWGLEVSIDCAGPASLQLTSGSIDGVYEACVDILATGVAVDGSGATLRARESVVLGQDFNVASGRELVVEIWGGGGGLGFASVEDDSPIEESVYNASFYVERAALSLGAGDEIRHFAGYSSGGTSLFSLTLKPGGGAGLLHLEARQDGGGLVSTAPGQEIALPAGWTKLEVSWMAAAGTGQLLVAIDDGAFSGLTGLDNDSYTVESVRWGAIDGRIGASSGLLRLDGFQSWR